MKNFLFLLYIVILVVSCEKPKDNTRIIPRVVPHVLDDSHITAIAFDHHGNAWIGTSNSGLIRVNANDTVVYDSTVSNLCSSCWIWDIAIDSENNVWLAWNGLVQFNGTEFIYYSDRNEQIGTNVNVIAIDSKDNIWFDSEKGISKYNGGSFNFFENENTLLPGKSVSGIAIDKNDMVWVAENGKHVKETSLVKISNDNWTVYGSDELGFTPYWFGEIRTNSKNQVCGVIDYSLNSERDSDQIRAFVLDGQTCKTLQNNSDSLSYKQWQRIIGVSNDDDLWFSDYVGNYFVFDGQTWSLNQQPGNGHSIFDIEQANNGDMWLGTGKGILVVNP